MGKFLKDKAKRSLPLFVIICLLNILGLGLSFNLHFNFVKVQEKGLVNLAVSVQADNASTTVSVKNAPPAFSGNATEVPTSTSTTPINVGGSIGFQATGLDGEGDDYWLMICSTNSATSSQPVGSPSCGATTFCTSAKASSSASASCTYSNITDPGAETRAWFAFVCDDHYGDPRCSPTNQGTGNGGSPFYVNHAPHINQLKTTLNFRDPGASVTITATTTDYDHASGNYNVQNLFVCSTNSWTVGSGCGATELCHGSSSVPSTASSTVSCSYAIPIPTDHTSFSYYGFVKDQYKLAATNGQGTSSTYTVNNVAPTISNVTLNRGNNITMNIKNAPQVVVYSSSTSVTDNNGCTDLSSATSTIYINSATGQANCAANDNYCYQIAAANCHFNRCSGSTSATAGITCTTSMAFFAVPTDASGPASTTTSWFTKIKVTDALGMHGSSSYVTLNGVEVISAAALDITEATIPYGTIQAGTNTGATNQITTVVNFGNTPIDSSVYGYDMLQNGTGPLFIGIENQKHLVSAFNFNTQGTVTSSSTPDRVEVDVARPNSQSNVSNPIYWGIAVPFGTPSVNFAGENYFIVVMDKHDPWQYSP